MLRKMFRWPWRSRRTQQDQLTQEEKQLWARAFLDGLEAKDRRDKEFQQILDRGGK